MLSGRNLEPEEILGELKVGQKWEFAIVLQGPYSPPHTEIAVREFLRRNDADVLIIVSTYKEAKSLLSPFEKTTALSSGRLQYLFSEPPERSKATEFWKDNFRNQNLQRFSSYIGLRHAYGLGIKMALKCRVDAFLGARNVCKILSEKCLSIPVFAKTPSEPVITSRIVISDHAKRQRDQSARHWRMGEYHIADHWLFGCTQDLLNFFDIRDGTPRISIANSAETNITERWMRQVGIEHTPEGIAEIVARYFVVVSGVELEFVWMKSWHSYSRYIRYGLKHLVDSWRLEKRDWGPMITPERWLEFVEYYRNR